MKRFLTWSAAILVIALIALGGAATLFLHTPADYDRRIAAVEAQAERIVNAGHVPGVMWAIVAPGEIVATGAAGFADIDSGSLMTPDTVFPIGSISKVLVGLSAAIAADEGRLDLEAPLRDYLTVPFDPPDGAARTFIHLATHTAGIIDTDAGYEAAGYHFGDTRHPVALPVFLTRYLGADGDLYTKENFGDWSPGARYVYSNVGAGLAGQAIADAVGQPFETYSVERIVEPLALTGFWGPMGPPQGDGLAQAILYERNGQGGFAALPPYGLATWPDGQFNASAGDLAKFMAVLMNDGVWNGVQVLPASAVTMQQTPRISDIPGKETPGDYIGLFWERETLELGPLSMTFVGHSGGDPGVITFMYRVPDNPTAFVLMFNGEPNSTRGLLSMVRLLRLLAGMPLPSDG